MFWYIVFGVSEKLRNFMKNGHTYGKDGHKNLSNHEFIKVITEWDLVFINSDVIFISSLELDQEKPQ